MPLQSLLLRNDPKLEAAATTDSAHILPGARGPHVVKIQIALSQLEGIRIDLDGAYGPITSAAVLSFKRTRVIVNPRYQSEADDIVGIMTMAALDRELLALESAKMTFVPALMWRPIRGPRPGAS